MHLTRRAGTERNNRLGTAWACMVAATIHLQASKALIGLLLHFGGLMTRIGWQKGILNAQGISYFGLVWFKGVQQNFYLRNPSVMLVVKQPLRT